MAVIIFNFRQIACVLSGLIWITKVLMAGGLLRVTKLLLTQTVLNIVYIAKIEDESLYDPLFIQALFFILLTKCAMRLSSLKAQKETWQMRCKQL